MTDVPTDSPSRASPLLVAKRTVALLRLFFAEDRGEWAMPIATAIAGPLTVGYLASRLSDGSEASLARIVAMGITTAFVMPVTQVGAAVMTDRFDDRMDLIRVIHVPKAAYFASRIGVGVAESLMIAAIGIALLQAAGLADLDGGGIALALTVAFFGSAGLCSLGALAASSGADRDTSWTLVTAAALGLVLVSPVLYAEAALPMWVRPISWLSPFTHLLPQFQALLDRGPLPPARFAATLVLGTVLAALAYRRLRW